jgi:hypothetical protein
MYRRIAAVSVALLAASLVAPSGAGAAGGPTIERSVTRDTIDDAFFADLCGIATRTTVIEKFSIKTFADESQTVHVERSYVPADKRLPIEKGAATAFYTPDGARRVVGKPIQLISQSGGGVLILDAGWVQFDPFDNPGDMRGPHPSLTVDLADYYCP